MAEILDKAPDFPRDIRELIFTTLVDSFESSPTYQWIALRHLSPHQMHRIEYNFRMLWLKYMSVTLHLPARNSSAHTTSRDFVLSPFQDSARNHDIAVFLAVEHPRFQSPVDKLINDEQDLMLKPAWSCYMNSALKKHVTVRFCEGFGGYYMRGGHLINNTELPGLEVSESGMEISFQWKAAIQELFQEAGYMWRYTQRKLAEQTRSQLDSTPGFTSEEVTAYQLTWLVTNLQLERRVAVIEHRRRRKTPAIQPSNDAARSLRTPFPGERDDS
ncbi:hypothetical protein Daus18300_008270 [Diaporthe australafricana]|uniref:Uncharacterized protein n=1 Tax=Diaporthe australafricana TaxID=127596 RepID=A0ABR3WJ02_9PEZI